MYRDNAKAVEDYAAVARYENVFPELAESEDERIRKGLERLISTYDPNNEIVEGKFGVSARQMLTYLEKQKEQKPAWSEEDKANLDNIIWLCENCEKGIENTWIPSQATQIKHLIKSLRPQKQEWSEEDGKELIQVKVKPIMGYHKSCGFVATKVELEGYGVVCENGEGTIYIKK